MSNLIQLPARPVVPSPVDDRREVAPEVDVSAEAAGVIELPLRADSDHSRFSPAMRGAAVLALFAIGAALAALLAAVIRSL